MAAAAKKATVGRGKAGALRAEPDAELVDKITKLREEIFNSRFKATTEPIDNPGQIREQRKEVARCLTILRERELAVKPRARKLSRAERKQANATAAARPAAKAKAKATAPAAPKPAAAAKE